MAGHATRRLARLADGLSRPILIGRLIPEDTQPVRSDMTIAGQRDRPGPSR
jgi:hypothetical protein